MVGRPRASRSRRSSLVVPASLAVKVVKASVVMVARVVSAARAARASSAVKAAVVRGNAVMAALRAIARRATAIIGVAPGGNSRPAGTDHTALSRDVVGIFTGRRLASGVTHAISPA